MYFLKGYKCISFQYKTFYFSRFVLICALIPFLFLSKSLYLYSMSPTDDVILLPNNPRQLLFLPPHFPRDPFRPAGLFPQSSSFSRTPTRLHPPIYLTLFILQTWAHRM